MICRVAALLHHNTVQKELFHRIWLFRIRAKGIIQCIDKNSEERHLIAARLFVVAQLGIDAMAQIKDIVNKHIRQMVERIVTQFQPEKIILFGSHARGDGTADSDVDLLVVMNVNGSKRRQAVAIDLSLEGIPLPADIIVTTPKELGIYHDTVGSIIREAVHEGKVLYERAA